MSPRTKAQYEEIRRARKAQILDAARRVFAAQGFHATRMSDIAQAIGVSQGTLYHYFRSKDGLFMALFSTWAEKLEDVVKGLPDGPSSAADKLSMMSRVGLDYLSADEALLPVFVEFWAYALHNPQAAASFRSLFQALQESCAAIISEGIASGEFKPVDVQTLSALPLAILDGVTLLSLLVGRDLVDPEQVIEKSLQLVFDGLLAKTGGGSL
jgi:AcrR family transcriptional regulator